MRKNASWIQITLKIVGTFKKVVYTQVRTNKAVSSIYLIHLEGNNSSVKISKKNSFFKTSDRISESTTIYVPIHQVRMYIFITRNGNVLHLSEYSLFYLSHFGIFLFYLRNCLIFRVFHSTVHWKINDKYNVVFLTTCGMIWRDFVAICWNYPFSLAWLCKIFLISSAAATILRPDAVAADRLTCFCICPKNV